MTKQEKQWRAESDAHVLETHAAILSDKERHDAALKVLEEKVTTLKGALNQKYNKRE